MFSFFTQTRLQQMALSPDVHLAAITAYLDSLSHDERWTEVSQLGRREQRSLFHKAERGVTAEDLVPTAYEEVFSVRHLGRNTLPLPPPHHLFEKRFSRSMTAPDRLYGYNEAPSRRLLGPGYFVALPTEEGPEDYREAWKERGAWVVDYFRVPDGAVPEEWPPVLPNSEGLQRFVYGGTRDYLRKVSSHVTIGTAYKGEKALDHYFVLCRVV